MYRIVGSAAILALCSCWSSARPPSAPKRDLHIALGVDQIQLSNGLKVIVVPSPGASEVSVTVRYGVGASDDPVGREGLAHLVEHLMFEHLRGDQALFDVLEDRALTFTGFTSLDSTVYSEKGAPEQLEELLEIEAVRLGQACSDIPEAAFVRQREIVRNELREREDDDRVQAALHQAVYAADHPFGRRSTVESVAAATRDQACELAAKRYVPSNAVVVVSGPVSLHDAKPLLDRTLGRLPATSAEPARAKPFDPRARRSSMAAPVKQPWFLLAWPLPTDPAQRTRLRAVASMAATLVHARINGEVSLLELGSGSAREIVIAVAPSKEISIEDALDHTKDAIARMGPWFGSGIYEHVKNRALYRFAASLESGIERDLDLAEIAASGRDAGSVTDEALHALLSMSRDDANDLVHSSLDPDKAIVAMLRPSSADAGGVDSLAPPIHEERHRKTEDPAEARKPMETVVEPTSFDGVESYALKNGLQVVLMPLSTMPTLEVRLSFPVGTGDEAARQRGIALVAADAIDPPFDNAMFEFIQAGGRINAVVGFDQTVFSVQGLAANLDLLLAGLSTTVRDGGYDRGTVRDVVKWRRADTLDPRDGLATGTWREALFGQNHPYRYASLWDHADRSASDLDALERFQSQHYLPDGATLVIAGQFDTTVAQRWVDYHFEKWSGTPPIRSEERAPFQPFAFAQVLEGSQLTMQIAFSTSNKNAIAVEIVAEMLDEVIADVREQLAASYGLNARVIRRRLSTTIQLAGSIDANRAADAMALLRDRLARLRERGDAAASQFVSARRRVLTRHSSVDTRAASLADSVIERLSFDDTPRLNHVDVTLARSMTLDSVATMLDGIELTRAAIMLRGPEAALKAAYAAIGREPVFLK